MAKIIEFLSSNPNVTNAWATVVSALIALLAFVVAIWAAVTQRTQRLSCRCRSFLLVTRPGTHETLRSVNFETSTERR